MCARPRRQRVRVRVPCVWHSTARGHRLLVVGLALLSVSIFYTVATRWCHDMAIRSLVGLALGASLISVFARLGGGITPKQPMSEQIWSQN